MKTVPRNQCSGNTDPPSCSLPDDRPRYLFPNQFAVQVASRRSRISPERVDEALALSRKALRGQPRGDGSGLWRFFVSELGFTELEARRLAKVLFVMAGEVVMLPSDGGAA
jgi:hypothetical protein